MTKTIRFGILAAALLLLGWYFWQWQMVSPLDARGSDFSVTYVAGMLVREGHPGSIYNQGAEASAHATLLPPAARFDLPYINPPPVALVGAAMTLFDPDTAYRVWTVLQLAFLFFACVIATRTAQPEAGRTTVAVVVAIALAGTATFPFILLGQWGGVMALTLAIAYRLWKQERDFAASLLLTAVWIAIKPHLLIGIALWMIGRHPRSASIAILTAVAGVTAISLAVFGLDSSLGFFGALSHAFGNTPPPSTVGILGLITSWRGTSAVSQAVGISLSALAAIACLLTSRRRGPNLETQLTAVTCLSLLASPHLMTHDLVILAPLFATLALPRAPWRSATDLTPATRPQVYGVWVALSLAVAVDAGNSALFPPGRLVPWVLIAFAAWTSLQSPPREPDAHRSGYVTPRR